MTNFLSKIMKNKFLNISFVLNFNLQHYIYNYSAIGIGNRFTTI